MLRQSRLFLLLVSPVRQLLPLPASDPSSSADFLSSWWIFGPSPVIFSCKFRRILLAIVRCYLCRLYLFVYLSLSLFSLWGWVDPSPLLPAPDVDGCWWVWSSRCNNWQGKWKYLEKICRSVALSTTNPTWPDSGINPGLRGGKPATTRLSCGTAGISLPSFTANRYNILRRFKCGLNIVLFTSILILVILLRYAMYSHWS
jgi:hypothetical protein